MTGYFGSIQEFMAGDNGEGLLNRGPLTLTCLIDEQAPATMNQIAITATGIVMSIQGSSFHYCNPKEDSDDGSIYTSLEVGFPTAAIQELLDYAEDPESPTATVYGYVPVEVINDVISKNGGIRPATREELSAWNQARESGMTQAIQEITSASGGMAQVIQQLMRDSQDFETGWAGDVPGGSGRDEN